MKLWILSDLHLDHQPDDLIVEPPDHDIMVCAGDVRDDLVKAIASLEDLTDQPIIFPAGNHEFYGFEGKALSLSLIHI